MRKLILVTLLTAGIAGAQTQPGANPPVMPGQEPTPPQAMQPKAPEFTADTPVITLDGLCPDKPGTDAKSPECKTVVTKAQFEKLANTLAPNIPASAKQQLAGDYARMLVLSEEAKKRGLDKSEKFQDIMQFMKLRVLSQELLTNLQQTSKPSQAEINDYYQQNKAKYEELALKRVFIPRNLSESADKKPGAAPPKPRTDAELQADGDKAKARLVAGEGFEKVQKELYEAAGYKTPPPPTTIPNWRKDVVPPGQQDLFDLKKGDFSKVVIEPSGAFVYQIDEKKSLPVEQVQPEIEQLLSNEKMKKAMESVTGNIKPEMNQAYFQSLGGEREPVRALTPGAQAAPMSAPPARPTPGRTAAKPTTSKPANTTPKQ